MFTGTLAGFNSSSAEPADSFTLYMVDSTQGVAIETDNYLLVLGRVAPAP